MATDDSDKQPAGAGEHEHERREQDRAAFLAAWRQQAQLPEEVRAQIGVMLPDTDPTVGEILLSALRANPGMHPAAILVALVQGAPDQVLAVELAIAMFELLVCKNMGHLVWVETASAAILTGIRRSNEREALMFGNIAWPLRALISGPPKAMRIRTSRKDIRVVWVAADPMEGVVIRQSDAIALGNCLVEGFGGRLIEDRVSPETMRSSYMEGMRTKAARQRAMALFTVEDMIVRGRVRARPDHCRVAMAEAIPSTIKFDQILVPVDRPDVVYEMESRLNTSWVLLVSREPGKGYAVPPGSSWASPRALDEHLGFTEEWARVPNTPDPIDETEVGEE